MSIESAGRMIYTKKQFTVPYRSIIGLKYKRSVLLGALNLKGLAVSGAVKGSHLGLAEVHAAVLHSVVLALVVAQEVTVYLHVSLLVSWTQRTIIGETKITHDEKIQVTPKYLCN
jgi:hypothetical protein